MAIKSSTGLRDGALGDSSIKDLLDLGFIDIYAGAVPATADADVTGHTKLCRISVNSTGTGLSMDPPSGGIMSKPSGDVWSGTNLATGTATFYRHVGASDTGALSTTQPRLQGTVSVAGADLNLASVALVSAATQPIDTYHIVFPTL
jgi:hypothetical protein